MKIFMKRTDKEPVEIAFAISTGTVFSQGHLGSNGTSLGLRGKGIESQLSVGRV